MSRWRLMHPVFLGAALTLSSACEDRAARATVENNFCPPDGGCVNAQLVAAVEARCRDRKKDCALSLEDVFGDLHRVYFVQIPARLDECTTLRVDAAVRRSHETLCEYTLLEKDGRITRFLRGWCQSDLHARRDLGFETGNAGFVSVMDPSKSVVFSRDTGVDARSGQSFQAYVLTPPRGALVDVDPHKDPCAGSP